MGVVRLVPTPLAPTLAAVTLVIVLTQTDMVATVRARDNSVQYLSVSIEDLACIIMLFL